MLGTKNSLRHRDDITTAEEYINFLFGKEAGYAAIGACVNGIYREKLIQRPKLNGFLSQVHIEQKEDVYLSANLFLNSETRAISNLKRLTAIYVDLDCYKKGLHPDQTLFILQSDIFDHELPQPSVILFSGQGLQLIWKISDDRNALPTWKRVEAFFHRVLIPFGADPKAMDASRILRMPFTKSSKTGEEVKILDLHDISYSLYELIQELNIPGSSSPKSSSMGKATAKQRTAALSIAKKLGVEAPDFNNFKETYAFIHNGCEKLKNQKSKRRMGKRKQGFKQILQQRIDDLVTLAQLRQGQNCGRECILFLLRLWYGELTNDFESAKEMILEVNQMFQYPLTQKEVITATLSAEKAIKRNRTYRYRDTTIIDMLQITEEELCHLPYFSNVLYSQKLSRRSQNRSAYLRRLKRTGKATKRQSTQKSLRKMRHYLAHNLSREEICRKLKISRSTFYRYKRMVAVFKPISCTRTHNTHKRPIFSWPYYYWTPVGSPAVVNKLNTTTAIPTLLPIKSNRSYLSDLFAIPSLHLDCIVGSISYVFSVHYQAVLTKRRLQPYQGSTIPPPTVCAQKDAVIQKNSTFFGYYTHRTYVLF